MNIRWSADVAEIEDLQEAAQFVASFIKNRATYETPLTPDQMYHLAVSLGWAAKGNLQEAKNSIEAALAS